MRRERKIEQKQERFLAKQEERRQRKMDLNSQPEGRFQPLSSANAAAVDGERNIEGMKETAAAVESQSSSRVWSDGAAPRWAGTVEGARSNSLR
jgi:hypothetical protein